MTRKQILFDEPFAWRKRPRTEDPKELLDHGRRKTRNGQLLALCAGKNGEIDAAAGICEQSELPA